MVSGAGFRCPELFPLDSSDLKVWVVERRFKEILVGETRVKHKSAPYLVRNRALTSSLQTTIYDVSAKKSGWKPGEDVLITPSVPVSPRSCSEQKKGRVMTTPSPDSNLLSAGNEQYISPMRLDAFLAKWNPPLYRKFLKEKCHLLNTRSGRSPFSPNGKTCLRVYWKIFIDHNYIVILLC